MTTARDRYAWLDRAACRPYPDWDERSDYEALLVICAGCPVRHDCLLDALNLGTDGVRGNTTAKQRGRRRRNSSSPKPALDLNRYIHMVDGRTHNPHGDDPLFGYRRRILDYPSDTLSSPYTRLKRT